MAAHKKTPIEFQTEALCGMFKCTPEQLKEQYRANAEVFRVMLERAIATGKRVNGYTASALQTLYDRYVRLSQ